MITIITGDNSFEIERATRAIIANFKGDVEKIDGSTLELKQLPNLLMGATLFADKRLLIVKNLSENKEMWASFSDWIPRISDDTQVVMVETKLDKRTVTYKELKKQAKIIELMQWTDRDVAKAEKWVFDEAKQLNILLDTKGIQVLVRRVGLDQWQLFHALEKLFLVEKVTVEIIESLIDANSVENVFNLFDAALRGDGDKVIEMIRILELAEDPYRLFALLSGQAFQLAVVVASESSNDIAKDFGVHPYIVSKLASSAKKLGRNGARKIVIAFAEADDDMKLSRAEPWLLIERALMKVVML